MNKTSNSEWWSIRVAHMISERRMGLYENMTWYEPTLAVSRAWMEISAALEHGDNIRDTEDQ